MAFGNLSLYFFISVFGGTTLLLFLICFCCQRKLQARTMAMAQVTDVEGQRRQQRGGRAQRRSDTHTLISSIVTPPPDYATVIKKDSMVPVPEEPSPPAYETAVANLKSDGYV